MKKRSAMAALLIAAMLPGLSGCKTTEKKQNTRQPRKIRHTATASETEESFDKKEDKNLSAWEKQNDTGSIMQLVDYDWLNRVDGAFRVSTPEQLASVVYYINTRNAFFTYTELYLEADIDLTGYDWAPMGWVEFDSGNPHEYAGVIDGQGHTIKGMKIKGGYNTCGFVGYSTNLSMRNISFVDAEVTGTDCLGICGGEVIDGEKWTNVYAQGNINNDPPSEQGGLVGWSTDLCFEDCSCDYTLNGGSEVFHYLTYKERRTEEIGIEEVFTLVLNDDYSITRDDFPGYHNLGWHVERNGETILEASAVDHKTGEPILTLEKSRITFRGESGTYSVYLDAFIDGIYIRVSNIIEFTL